MTHRVIRRAAVFAVSLASLTVVPATLAQPGGGFRGGPDGAFGPPVSNRDLDVYTQVLGLSADQEEAAKALLDGYQESYRQAAQEMRDQMEAARESGGDDRDPARWDQMRKGMEGLREARVKSEASFRSDLQTVLTPQQAELWPKAQREVRREKTLGRGLLSGEGVDVNTITTDVIESLPEAQRQAVIDAAAPTLEQYAQDLDRELVARNEAFETGMSRGGELMAGGDMDGVQALFEKSREASDRVRDVNQRYARQVEALLPEASRPAFQDAIRRASFPEVYRETYAKRAVAAAVSLADLDENQRAGVQAVADTYNRDLAAANETMTAAILEREKNMTMRDVFRGRGGGGRRGGMDELNQPRRDLDDTTLESLKKLLTPEQFAQLPAREERPDRNGGRNRDDQDGRGDPGDAGDGGGNRQRRRSF